MESILKDLRQAGRIYWRSPGPTLAAILTLALGIGANTAIFSAVNSILLRPLPYQDPDQLVMFWEFVPNVGPPFLPITGANFHEWKAQERVVASMAGFRIASRSNGRAKLLSTERDSVRVNTILISADFLDVLQVEPFLGRGFSAGEDQPGAARAAIVSYSLWNSFFGADREVLGRVIQIDGASYQIIGVLPAGFYFPPPVQAFGSVHEHAGEVFVPYYVDPNDQGPSRSIRAVARLREGMTIERALPQLQPVADRLHQENETSNPEGLKPVLLPLHGQAVEQSRPRLAVLQAVVGLILLIACVNVANLVLARGASRRREFALRAALGAARGRLARMLMTECLLLSFAGGALGVGVAWLALAPLSRLGASHIPRLGAVEIDFSVLAFTLFLTVLTALAFGLLPALQGSRLSLVQALRAGRGAGGNEGKSRFYSQALVISEVALAIIPLVGAGLMLHSFWLAQQAEVGFEPQGTLSVQLALPEQRYPDPHSIQRFYQRLLGDLQSLPGVEQGGAVTLLPFSGGRAGGILWVEGRPKPDQQSEINYGADFRWIMPGYLETLHIPLIEGRAFNQSDRADSQPVAIVDERLAKRIWPQGDVLGARLTWGDESVWRTVVGVAGAIQYQDLNPQADAPGLIYLPQDQEPHPGLNMVLRVEDGNPAGLAPAIRRQVAHIDAELPVELRTLESYVEEAQQGQRSPAILLGTLAALALALAAVGLYGVLSYLARQRRQEIGIRLALGATRQRILRLMMSQTAWMVLIGLALGLAGAVALSRYLASQYLSGILFGITPLDPLSYLGAVLLFLLIAALASYLPARRALGVDPSVSLRAE